MKRIDITGQTFGELFVLNGYGAICTCKCSCGNIVNVPKGNLRSGHTKSCGCKRVEVCRNNFKTHGATKTRLHNIWRDIKKRCFNPKYKQFYLYGGRGITMCDAWKDFEVFRQWSLNNGYKDNLTIERIDVNGNYEPENCTWIQAQFQARNKRNNHLIIHNGKELTIAEWSEITGIMQSTIWYRLSKGWSVEKTLNTPVRRRA